MFSMRYYNGMKRPAIFTWHKPSPFVLRALDKKLSNICWTIEYMVKLSIVIPAYNAEKYLGKCLDHILRQTYDNFEIIVVNDASEDCTQNIIESYASQYSMITGVKNEVNQGPAASRQRGMETATGKYITFVDADDWYSRNDSIELIMREIERNQVDCLMYGYKARHIHGIMIPHNFPYRIRGKYDAGALIEIKEKIQAPAFHYVWNKVYNLELLRNENIRFDENLKRAEDVKFNDDFICKSGTFFLLNKCLYVYNCCNLESVSRKQYKIIRTSGDAYREIELLENSYGETRDKYKLCGVTENTFYFLKVNIYRKYIYLLDKYGDLIPADEIQKRDIYKEVVSDISSLKRLEIKEKYRLEKMVGAVRRKMKNILKTKRISRQSQEGNK